MRALARKFQGGALSARILRSSSLTVIGFGGSQMIRLASNLILTRLLFPEAFGMMAIVMILMQGLTMFSDVGTVPAILQNKRGDDPEFLNTAWTINVVRGFLLFAFACGVAYPVAWFYDVALLAPLIMASGLTLILQGFMPTKMQTANRHLQLGRVTILDMVTQIVGAVAAIVLALWLQSVWALVWSGLISMLVQLFINNRFLPGPSNRFRWEPEAGRELIHFGKWIFLATVCGFVFTQSDRIILGRLLDLELLGIYNIGFFLAAFPLLLGNMIVAKVLIPIYRETPPKAAPENYAKLRRMRIAVTAALLLLQLAFAMSGVWLIELLYDARYVLAGPILVLIACMQIPLVIGLTYDQAALAEGDSRSFFVLQLARAVAMVAGLLLGFEAGGLIGALIGQGIAMICVYPVVVWLARRVGVWDGLHDSVAFGVGVAITSAAFWIHAEPLSALQAVTGG
ncbi:oligosaccharide flippase family protein [Primorskyibacter sp. S187A]|uniref:oligosaccharide flippase family protein n=1 Tax=Primorskyibacter sp. S187A TaxID=3415130 RepID=UPI003C7C4ADD